MISSTGQASSAGGCEILLSTYQVPPQYKTSNQKHKPHSARVSAINASRSDAAMAELKSIGVLMTCTPTYPYLIEELEKRFTLYKLLTFPDQSQFLATHNSSIRAVVGSATGGADAELIDKLPHLEIVSSFSVGLDKIDLSKCREKGIRVTNTPDVLTDDVADLAIGLMLAVLRRLCESDRYVRSGLWKKGDYKLTTKVCFSDSEYEKGLQVFMEVM